MLDPDDPDEGTKARFALMVADAGALARYWLVFTATCAFFRARQSGSTHVPTFKEDQADQAIDCLRKIDAAGCEELILGWTEWDREYREIESNSPRWRLRNMIELVSRTHMCLSWPKRWERDVIEWAESDESGICFDDRLGVLSPDFRRTLSDLRRECGGWLYRCEETGLIRFAKDDALPAIWKEQDRLAELDRQKAFGFANDVSRPNWPYFRRRDLSRRSQA